jgi:hypothetical protein
MYSLPNLLSDDVDADAVAVAVADAQPVLDAECSPSPAHSAASNDLTSDCGFALSFPPGYVRVNVAAAPSRSHYRPDHTLSRTLHDCWSADMDLALLHPAPQSYLEIVLDGARMASLPSTISIPVGSTVMISMGVE